MHGTHYSPYQVPSTRASVLSMRGRTKWPKHLEQNNVFRHGVGMTRHLSGSSTDNINLIDMGMVRGIIKEDKTKSKRQNQGIPPANMRRAHTQTQMMAILTESCNPFTLARIERGCMVSTLERCISSPRGKISRCLMPKTVTGDVTEPLRGTRRFPNPTSNATIRVAQRNEPIVSQSHTSHLHVISLSWSICHL